MTQIVENKILKKLDYLEKDIHLIKLYIARMDSEIKTDGKGDTVSTIENVNIWEKEWEKEWEELKII